MDASPITIGLLGAGVLLAWSAVANRNPIDEVKAAFGVKVEPRPLAGPTPKFSTGAAYGGPALGTADGGAGYMGASMLRNYVDIIAYAKARVPNVKVGSTTGGNHVAGSKHYQAKAVDFPGAAGGGRDPQCEAVYAAFLPLARSGQVYELYYQDRAWRAGRPVAAVDGHDGHVHVSVP